MKIAGRQLAPRDTWPEIRLTILPLPWSWVLKPRLYRDDLHPLAHASLSWLMVRLEWYGQETLRDLFTEEIEAPHPDPPPEPPQDPACSFCGGTGWFKVNPTGLTGASGWPCGCGAGRGMR